MGLVHQAHLAECGNRDLATAGALGLHENLRANLVGLGTSADHLADESDPLLVDAGGCCWPECLIWH